MAFLTPEQQINVDNGLGIFNGPKITMEQQAINAQALNNANPINLTQTQPTTPVNLQEITTPMEATTQETQQSDISQQLQDLNNKYLGKSAFTTQQETTQGIPDLIKTQNDLTSQYNTIKNEALQIPLQMQQQATGRGITAGGLAPLETARTRTNAIQALGINSLLESSKGNLATAQTLVDKAVKAKYDPITEQIDALTANLKLIKDDPATSLADKNRATAQLDIQEAKKAQIAKEKEDQTNIYNTANEAAKNGADALTLQKIQNTKTPMEALQYASTYLGREYTDKIKQQEFSNNLALSNLNLSKEELAQKIKQQVVSSGLDLATLQLNRDKFASDTNFQKAQLALDYAKLSGTTTKAPVVKDINGVTKQWNATTSKWEDVSTGAKDNSKALEQISLLKDTLNNASSLSDRAGSYTWWEQTKQGIFGATRFTNLEAYANTLKTNVLTMLSDPGIKKFFGPQMTEKDVELMTSSATTLDPRKQGKTEFKKELERLQKFIDKAEKDIKSNSGIKKTKEDLKIEFPQATPEELDALFKEESFSKVDGDTNSAIVNKIAKIDDGEKGGQCGRFVNKLTGLGVGDSYASKIAKMNPYITEPKPGMVFTMPYKDTGHVGIIVDINDDGTATVKDSNYGLDGKVKTHKIAISKMTGFANI